VAPTFFTDCRTRKRLQFGLDVRHPYFPGHELVMWFSRQREFRADAGGAKLGGTGNMIGALERLDVQHGAALPGQMAAFGISGRFDGALRRLFMSHPPIAERIAALRAGHYA
jgi:heat shock protein HtpX